MPRERVVGFHDVEVVSEIGRLFGLHALALEDVVNIGQGPKLEDYEGYMFCVLRHFHDVDGKMLPELAWPWGYPAALGLIAVVAIALLYYFRRKDSNAAGTGFV